MRQLDPYDIINKDFFKYRVIEYIGKKGTKKGYRYMYECLCSCGRSFITNRDSIVQSRRKSCLTCDNIYEKKAEEYIGKIFNRLTVIGVEKVPNSKGKYNYFLRCSCSCNSGKEIVVERNSIIKGHTKSCGCLVIETSSRIGTETQKKHFKSRRGWYFIKNGERVPCKSSLEVIFASYLLWRGVNFEYEPETFLLENKRRYTPDFYITDENRWVEVKGQDKEGKYSQKDKRELFSKNHNLTLMFWNELKEFCGLRHNNVMDLFYRSKQAKIPTEEYLPSIFEKNLY